MKAHLNVHSCAPHGNRHVNSDSGHFHTTLNEPQHPGWMSNGKRRVKKARPQSELPGATLTERREPAVCLKPGSSLLWGSSGAGGGRGLSNWRPFVKINRAIPLWCVTYFCNIHLLKLNKTKQNMVQDKQKCSDETQVSKCSLVSGGPSSSR